MVTIQLPLYNEKEVAARLIEAVGAFSWPLERLEVQVLDDSTDATCDVVDREVQVLRMRGLSVHVLRRKRRRGFKAGALANGLAVAKGEFIAIF